MFSGNKKGQQTLKIGNVGKQLCKNAIGFVWVIFS